jgi:hypothetical protein
MLNFAHTIAYFSTKVFKEELAMREHWKTCIRITLRQCLKKLVPFRAESFRIAAAFDLQYSSNICLAGFNILLVGSEYINIIINILKILEQHQSSIITED